MLMVVVHMISPVQLSTVREKERTQDWFDVTLILVTRNPLAAFADMQKSAGATKWLNVPLTRGASNLQDRH